MDIIKFNVAASNVHSGLDSNYMMNEKKLQHGSSVSNAPSTRQVVQGATKKTSIHGVSQITGTKRILVKLFWACVILSSLGECVVQDPCFVTELYILHTLSVPDNSLSWSPASGQHYQIGANVGPTYIAVLRFSVPLSHIVVPQ